MGSGVLLSVHLCSKRGTMPTAADLLDDVQRFLQDTTTPGSDGALWTRADLLESLNDAYRELLTKSQAVRRYTILDVPGRFSSTGTSNWEARYAAGGSYRKWTWSAIGYECSSMWEVQHLEGVTPLTSGEGLSQEWERAFRNPSDMHYQFALPRDNERIAAMWYDNRRLTPVTTRQLDALETNWVSMGDYPLAWTTGVGRSRTFEIYEIVTTYGQGYSLPGGPHGIPRRFSGVRTYTTAESNLYGIPRSVLSPDRQYLATTDPHGRPVTYHTSEGSLLILEVIGPEVPDMQEADTPSLLPARLHKYLTYGTLARAWSAEGEGHQPQLAAICTTIFARGIRVLRSLSWLTRKDADMSRGMAGCGESRKVPRVRLPHAYQRQW